MSSRSIPEDRPESLTAEKIYAEICTNIRETDDSSFRLLNLVPLVSGTALVGLVLRKDGLPPDLVQLLALFAAAITLGLFRWELRNVQTCSWLIKSAYAIEQAALAAQGRVDTFRPRPDAPQGIGKTEAEKLIYTVTVLAWLALPFAVGAVPLLPKGGHFMCHIVAIVILAGTGASLFAKTRVPLFAATPPSKLEQRARDGTSNART